MSNKTLLEVDDSIIKNNLLLTERNAEEREIDDLLRNFEKPDPPSLTFRPLPGACVKCKTDTGEKVFLNICHAEEIPAPEDLSEEQFFNVLEKEEPSWCIPMSIGHERFEEAKDGTKCLTYDIALNTKYFEKCQTHEAFWSFTIVTIISGVSEKHNRSIQSEYIVLKNRKVVGQLHDHRAQKREAKKPTVTKPLIEEINSPQPGNKQIRGVIDTKTEDPPQYVLLRRPKNGRVEELIGYFKLPSRLKCTSETIGQDEKRIFSFHSNDANFNTMGKEAGEFTGLAVISIRRVHIRVFKKQKVNFQKCYLLWKKFLPNLRIKDIRVDVCDDRIIVEAPRTNYLVDVFIPYTLDQDKVTAAMDQNVNVLRLNIPVI